MTTCFIPTAKAVLSLIAAAILLSIATGASAEPSPEQLEFFESKIRPLLSGRCYKCHSAGSEKLKGNLLLDSQAGLLKGGEGGLIVAPGEPEKSRLIEAVNYGNPDLQMPPKGKLSKEQIAVLTEWVKMGAPWPKEAAMAKLEGKAPVFDLEKRRREHWAWQPIKTRTPPSVKNTCWIANPVDRFILAKLEENHLAPAPPADRRTLIRRLNLDLIGLPPTPEEVENFVQDNSANAYEKVVDRLLSSPRFGERWARHWLDLVRYAETLGHEFDYPIQYAWRYRDYVIRAFNADVPYNQFVTEHIAGDLLENPRRHPTEHFNESIIGTGFFWLGQRIHSPVDIRQDQADVIDNQIDVLSKTFLGLTVACARCHDHKFDAIATKDFYALYGVLESSHYAQRAIDPIEQVGPKIEKLKNLKLQIRRETASLWSKKAGQISNNLLTASGTAQGTNPILLRWSQALAEKAVSEPGHPLYAWIKLAGTNNPATQEPLSQRWSGLVQRSSQSNQTTNYEVFADSSEHGFNNWFPDGAAFMSGTGGAGDFIVGSTNQPIAAILHEPALDDSVLSRRLEGALRSPSFEIKRRYVHILAAGQESRIKVCVDNFTMIRDPIYGGLKKYLSDETPAWITFDLEMWQGHRAHIELCDTSTADSTDEKEKDGSNAKGYLSVSRVLFSDEATPPASTNSPIWSTLLGDESIDSISSLAGRYQDAFRQAAKTWGLNPAHPSAAQRAQLAFLDWLVCSGLSEDASDPRLSKLVADYQQIELSLPEPVTVPAMADGNGVDEHVFIRGSHKSPGESVPRRFLTALSDETSPPFKQGSGRLELARRMTDVDNPLLARVMVNRIWLHLFGRGIVPTPDDFGALGQPPTHPELLDWLAERYRTDAGWSTKKLIKLLVTSNAYRMSSKPGDASAEENDPSNLLFHRMSVRRLEGEAIRDSMLAISGRLDITMFGPSVPTYLTEFMEGRGRPTKSGPMDGAGRRSIYLEVRRNFISPMMRTFDTPVPFTAIGRRTVSNVPAQSLILLNDPFVVDQAHLWARRILADTSLVPEERISKIYLMAFGREPFEKERTVALAFIKQQGATYGMDEPACWQDEKVWADLCHVMFNLKEFVFNN
ncbi:MAG: Protein of unknown function (DUF1553)/Protein of unknown function (DUF1549)/Planctomycete [Pedosphaera sp.]|nr:Protein of unknown function (DUF1553)/Protein of unknown function (DUF1549)/Planctomycete [Pedosphaera sp.]